MDATNWRLERGATLAPDGTAYFRVWAPRARKLTVQSPSGDWTAPMERDANGLYAAAAPGLSPGSRYVYVLDDERVRPDPVSRFQPEGVHGPSEIVDPAAFAWTDQEWRGLPLKDLIIYELHVGTFTTEGTFVSLLAYLDYLKDEVGVTALELMPVAEFPGARNWGYDGVHLYAPHSAHGGPHGLKTLVNACHAKGLAVILDVVYNHLGPEGNYLSEYGPYFTDRYQTPWGQAVNFDGEQSHEVRRYFLDNALYWVTEYHIDGLRLDAIHGIFDLGPKSILQELGETVHRQAEALQRTILVTAESDLNDSRVISDLDKGGWGLDAQWSDDFHHSLHSLLTGERTGYYQDFGRPDDLATALTEGFVYQGQSSLHREKLHGSPSRHLPGERFVIFSQNDDQVGNRIYGERLSALAPFPALKLAAGLVVGAPNIPLLFMGEEYGEKAPFLYFTSHTDPELARAVQEGRRLEFDHHFGEQSAPDPQDPQTLQRSLLQHHLRAQEPHHSLLRFYRDLIAMRKRSPALHNGDKEKLELTVLSGHHVFVIHRWAVGGEAALLVASLSSSPASFTPRIPLGRWRLGLNSEALSYGGSEQGTIPAMLDADAPQPFLLPPFAFVLYWRISE